jgi:phospholipid-binding lipoprotein MlaA
MGSMNNSSNVWRPRALSILMALFLALGSFILAADSAKAQNDIDYSLDDDFEDIADEGSDDPYESFNRAMFIFNNFFMTYLLKPLATAYNYAPEITRDGVRNALDNLDSPNDLVNDMLQGEFIRAMQIAERALINTTVGVGGIMDVASDLGIPKHSADFGQTLAIWGVGEGPYLVLPFFGPTNPRDAIGLGVDSVGDPLNLWARNTDREAIGYGRFGATAIDSYSRVMDDLEVIEETSIDFYAALRSLSRQHRRHQIKYGKYEDGPSVMDAEKP